MKPVARHRMTVARFGEEVAAGFLCRRGASIAGRNVRSGRGEIDLLAVVGGRRVAVEVKTRAHGSGDPLDGFGPDKAARVRRAAAALDPPVHRVDLVTVTVTGDGVAVRWLPEAG